MFLSAVPDFMLGGGGSVHTAHVRFTSQFGKTPTAKKLTPSYFPTIRTSLTTTKQSCQRVAVLLPCVKMVCRVAKKCPSTGKLRGNWWNGFWTLPWHARAACHMLTCCYSVIHSLKEGYFEAKKADRTTTNLSQLNNKEANLFGPPCLGQ